MYKIIFGSLSIVLILLIVVALFQLNQVNKTRQQVTAVRKEIRAIKKDIEKQEKEQKKAEILQKETKVNAEQKEEADTDAKAEESEESAESVETQEDAQKEAKEPEAGEEQKNQETDANAQMPETGNGKKIAIDPGHQGYNVDMSAQEPMGPGSSEMKAKATTGTQGSFTGVPEYELNLNISKQLREELKNRGYEVMLTREDNDTAISNKERAELATQYGADIYVRIHANGSDDSSVNGAFTMIPSAQNPYVGALHDKSYALGEAVINAYCESCKIKNSGVQIFDNMTGINWSTVPVIILEMGFMSNESDDTNMENPDFQKLMVQGIANGIDAYFAAGN